MSLKTGGKLPSGKYKENITRSPNYKNGSFQNLSDTPMMSDDASYWKLTRQFFRKHESKEPSSPVPSVKTDLNAPDKSGKNIIHWFGHSSYLLGLSGINILVDPVFSGYASPFSFMVKAFEGADVYGAEDMPSIDYLVLTHDHYDHLDYKTVVALRSKVKKVICSLGIGSHLRYWGYPAALIQELDWWQHTEPQDGIKFTAAPARHFSGRGIKRGQTFWSSFIVKTDSVQLYIGGDSGYDDHFSVIGKRMGGFDMALLECGQYNAMWPYIHMQPEETIQAAIDLKSERVMPVHWGKFSLAMHPWNEPIQRAVSKAANAGYTLQMPMIGQTLVIGGDFQQQPWWNI